MTLSRQARLERVMRGDPWCEECRDYHPSAQHRKAGLINADGNPTPPRPKRTDDQRLAAWMEKVQEGPGGCWLWTGAKDGQGYGHVARKMNGTARWTGAHRAIYEGLVGPIPEGLELDHLCRVRLCVNPAHLEPVTRSVNLKRGKVGGLRKKGAAAINAAKTHCKRGHPFDVENTRNIAGGRQCRECDRIASRLYQRRKAAERRAQEASTGEAA